MPTTLREDGTVGVSFGIVGGAVLPFLSDPAGLAKQVEDRGFDSITFGGHTHIPVRRRVSFAVPEAMVQYMAAAFDPFVCLAAAAVSTQRIALGTGVALVPEHHPIAMAKTVASVDRIAAGRLFLGIGAGWNDEIEDHGVKFEQRWAVTRERVMAMRTIWREPQPEFHGEFVSFDAMYGGPQPLQESGPPILMGANGRHAIRRVADYCDGWMPVVRDSGAFENELHTLRAEAEKQSRRYADLRIEPFIDASSPELLERVAALAVTRIHLQMPPPTEAGATERRLDQLAKAIERFR